ncbi:MAG: M56 family metallopeptidase [Verrucomicrobiota bacterium]
MSIAFLLFVTLKATLLAAGGVIGARILPPTWFKARRLIALHALWLLLVVPWIHLTPETAGLRLPATLPASDMGWLILIVWLFGTLLHSLRLIFEWRNLCLMLRQSQLHGNIAGIEIRLVHDLTSPCVFGAWHTSILMPVAALEWPARQWTAALKHELEHVRQSDGLHRIVCSLMRAIFWWNPLVRSLCHRVEIESEFCCDQAAASSPAITKRAYGEMLLGLATDLSWRMTPAWSSRHALRERIERLLQPAACGRCNTALRFAAMLVAVAATLLMACSIRPMTSDALHAEASLRIDANPFPGEK